MPNQEKCLQSHLKKRYPEKTSAVKQSFMPEVMQPFMPVLRDLRGTGHVIEALSTVNKEVVLN
eukprot:CCRYP_008436-RA/>CCRYP_008436-RA protein AED:0.46 eAED:0.46 QI:0/-1/0/1/-1/1/1/0/62